MKKMFFLLMTFMMISLSSCNDGNETNSHETKSVDNVVYQTMNADWIYYQNAQELVEMADMVFIGNVTGISFKLIDIVTGLPPTKETTDIHRHLITLYNVDIITIYKGEPLKTIQVRIDGGIMGYRVNEQLAVLGEDAKKGIPVIYGHPNIEIGAAYSFVVKHSKNQVAYVLNLDQSIFNLDDPFKKQKLGKTDFEEPHLYYNETSEANGNPLISAKDIIEHFGEDKWDTFWTKWQKDNPKWETRLDKEAVEKALAD